jgi:hypothetical protein
VKNEGEVTVFGVACIGRYSDGGAAVLLGPEGAVVAAETDHDGNVTAL